MKTVGLIVEYNPLHYGHVYHYEQAKAAAGADAAVAVMSGHFLQRGEPALVNKWARAEMALGMGADVVFELPVAYSAQPAEWFAYGAVSALEASGVVDALCFGSESGDIGWLQELAGRVSEEPDAFRAELKRRLREGASYPAAYGAAALELFAADVPGAADGRLAEPNNTLGLHYLIALQRLGSAIVPLTVARQKAGYHQRDITDSRIASATAIRALLLERGDLAAARPLLPDTTFAVLAKEWEAGRAPMNWERFARPLLHELASRSVEELAAYAEMAEGLEFRLKQALPALDYARTDLVEQLMQAAKTKRYTRTKLQRTLLRVLLGHAKRELSREALSPGVRYLRVLGFSAKGRALLKRMKTAARVPIVTNVTRNDAERLALDIRATSVYALGYPSPSADDLFRDFYQAPLQV